MQSAGPYDPLGACALTLLLSKMSIAALRAEVRKANTAYRNGEPIMSDQAYDQLLEQLRSKAPHAPELDNDATILLSLDNQPFDYWYSTLPVDTTLVVQPKIDGCTLALRYVEGELIGAWTRSGRCAMCQKLLRRRERWCGWIPACLPPAPEDWFWFLLEELRTFCDPSAPIADASITLGNAF